MRHTSRAVCFCSDMLGYCSSFGGRNTGLKIKYGAAIRLNIFHTAGPPPKKKKNNSDLHTVTGLCHRQTVTLQNMSKQSHPYHVSGGKKQIQHIKQCCGVVSKSTFGCLVV